ncbi:hypothetical protein F4861DRAFT_534869 [Xylaria intraflava]|nr:hypothetical protein F4861DRAFT_534869 [Xylaria intraflava]
MDTRNLTTAQKSSTGYDKGAAVNTKGNAPTTGAHPTGGNQNHPVFTPSYNSAMTTDGFKNDNIGGEATQQGDHVTAVADGTLPSDQQQQKRGDKNTKTADWNQADEAQKAQQQHQGSKLRGVFGRLKKGSDATGDETAEGHGDGDEGEVKQKTKGDPMIE